MARRRITLHRIGITSITTIQILLPTATAITTIQVRADVQARLRAASEVRVAAAAHEVVRVAATEGADSALID